VKSVLLYLLTTLTVFTFSMSSPLEAKSVANMKSAEPSVNAFKDSILCNHSKATYGYTHSGRKYNLNVNHIGLPTSSTSTSNAINNVISCMCEGSFNLQLRERSV